MSTHKTRIDPKSEKEWGTELSLKDTGYTLKLLVVAVGSVFPCPEDKETHYIRDGRLIALPTNEVIEYGDIYRSGVESYIAVKETTLIEIR